MDRGPRRQRRKVLASVVLGAGMTATVVAAAVSPAGAGPTRAGSSRTCGESGYGDTYTVDLGQQEPGTVQTYADPDSDLQVDVELGQPDAEARSPAAEGDDPAGAGSVSFSANQAVDAVIVTAGDDGYLYAFDPPARSGSHLTPGDGDTGPVTGISFCREPGPEATTTTTPPPETTTTTPPETTTTVAEETTTTVETTTTTVAGDGDEDPGDDDEGEDDEDDEDDGTGAADDEKDEEELPKTGNTTTVLLALGLALGAIGIILRLSGRLLRPPRPARP